MSSDDRRRELDALLREPTAILAPPDGAWETISRRANRRKWMKASAGVAAGVIVAAGAIPAVIAVRHNSSGDQSLRIAQGSDGQSSNRGQQPTPIPSVSPAGSLAGFFPESVSFVSATRGYLWGSLGTKRHGVVAETVDGGRTWVRRVAPPVNDAWVAHHGDSQIRFSADRNGVVGLAYGSKYFVTRDDATTWTPLPDPGYIDALETRYGKIWALVRHCQHCQHVSLYTATTANPTLTKVAAVQAMRGHAPIALTAGAASLAISGSPGGGTRVVVLVGSSGFWFSPDGTTWTEGTDPCQGLPSSDRAQSALVATPGARDVVAACGYQATGRSHQTKRTYVSTDSGRTWNKTPAQPSATGFLETLAAGTGNSVILGTSRGGAQITSDAGATWVPVAAGVSLSFVGYIDYNHIVAVADRDTGISAFASSVDGGANWNVVRFAGTP